MTPAILDVSLDETVAGIKEQFEGFVQHKSCIQVNINAIGRYYTSIDRCETIFNGTTYTGYSFQIDAIPVSGESVMKVTVFDKRGRHATTERTIAVAEYIKPAITEFAATRCNSLGEADQKGECVLLKIAFGAAPVGNKNVLAAHLYYKAAGDAEWNESKTVLAPDGYRYESSVIMLDGPFDPLQEYQ